MAYQILYTIHPQTDTLHKLYLCDTEADIPTEALKAGEIVITKDFQQLRIVSSETTVTSPNIEVGTDDILPKAITFEKIQDLSTARVLGRITANAGSVEELTGSAVTTLLNTFTATAKGLVPLSGGGTINFLRADGQWTVPPDTGITQLTGDVVAGSGSGSQVATIPNNTVTYAKIQDVSATDRFLGRKSADAGDVEELTGTEVTARLDTFTSALKGLVPPSGGGTVNFLRADGSWAEPPAGGGGVSWPLLAPDSNMLAPSYSFANDTDTGIYRKPNGDIGFAINGSERGAIGYEGVKSYFSVLAHRFGHYSDGDTGIDFFEMLKDVMVLRAGGQNNIVVQNWQVGVFRWPEVNEFEVEGNASKTTAGDWLANSDSRIKMDIEEITDGIKTIKKLKPCKFKYKPAYRELHPSIRDKVYYNFIAQDYRKVFPDEVKKGGDKFEGKIMLQMDTYAAQMTLFAAVKELIEKVEKLEKTVRYGHD